MLEIVPVETDAQHQQVRDLVVEFEAWDREATRAAGYDPAVLAEFYYKVAYNPSEFNPPSGLLLLALYDGATAGCGGVHKLSDDVGEIKRMYVRPAFRGKRIAKTLLETLIAAARTAGYSHLRLDTAVFMQEAQSLYKSVGFYETPPYYETPNALKPLTIFMEMKLSESGS